MTARDPENLQEGAPELRPSASNDVLTRRGEASVANDPETRRQFADFTKDEVARITVLVPGARLEQGSVYLDLDDIEAGPFVAIGNEEVDEDDRLVAKRDLDHEMWNRLAGHREPRVLRPR